MGQLPEYVFLKRGDSAIWVARDLEGHCAHAEWLANPDLLFSIPGCEIVKDQRKIKVARIPLTINGQPKKFYLKRYNPFSWRYRVGSLFGMSRAARSLQGAIILSRSGFSTGRPVAVVECRHAGILTKSFYCSEEIEGAKTVDTYWREDLGPMSGPEGFRRRRRFLKGLATLFGSLHDRNIYHDDLKDANVLVCFREREQKESFYLLDLEGIRCYRRLSSRRKSKNLAQLNRTLGDLLRQTEKLYLLKSYMGSNFIDRTQRRGWILEIIRKSNRKDRRTPRKM